MVILLLAMAAHSADPRLARWQVEEATPVIEPDGSQALWVPWRDGSIVGLRCDAEPDVVAIAKGARVSGDLVSPAHEIGVWQVVPPGSVRWSGFVVRDTECRVERLRTSATPWAWALSESRGQVDAERPALVGDAAGTWAGIDALRRGALRPAGPHPAGARRVWTGGASVRVGGRDWDRVVPDEDVRIQGPARVRVDMRGLGEAPSSCLLLDGALLCQDSEPGRAVSLVDERLVYGPRTLDDGTPVHPLKSWQIAVGPGEHRLRTDRDALVRVVTHPIETYAKASPTQADLQASEGMAVWTPPPPPEWATAPFVETDRSGEGRWLVRTQVAPVADGRSWQRLEQRHPDAAPPVRGELEIWLEPEAEDAVCTVQIGEARYAALAPTGIHRFGWIGPSEVIEPEISASGCAAWLHLHGAADAGSRSLAYLQVLESGDEAEVRVDASRDARLEVAIPVDAGPVEFVAVAGDRRELRFVVDPPAEGGERQDVDGLVYTDAIYLPLPAANSWRIRSDGLAMVRVRQTIPPEGLPPAPIVESEFPTGVRGEASFEGSSPAAYRVRALTSELPLATDDASRARLLVERGGLLAGRGAWALASRDLLRAEELQPGLDAFESPVGLGLRLARERELYGGDAWRPTGPVWVELDGEMTAVDRVRAQAASRGDYLGVATRTSGAEAARWWRRAILGGQVLTPEQRLEAFLVAASLPEHPDLQILRSGTRWDGVHLIRGAARRSRVRWPIDRDEDEDLLYPDEWAADRLVPLRRGWLLRIPARREGQPLHLRCLVRALSTTGPCRLLAEDAGGEIIASTLISGWGTPDVLWLPPGPALYLRLDEPIGAHAQLLWTVPGEVPGLERLAWESADEALQTTVLGPTAVRVHVRPQGDSPVTVRVWAAGQQVTQRVDGEGEVIVPVLREGPQEVRITIDRRSWVRVATRRARRGGPVAAGDRRAITLAEPTPEPTVGPAGQASLGVPEPAMGMPVSVPARTWTAAMTVGSAEWTPAEARGPVGAPPAVSVEGGLQAHVNDALWLEADLGVQARFDAAVIGVAHAGADWRVTRGRTRVFALGDLSVAAGPFASRNLGSARLDLGSRLVHPVWKGGTLQGVAMVRGRLRSSLDPSQPMEPNKARLWSRYAEDHRIQLALAASLRHRFSPWIVARGGIYATSNAPNDAIPVDHIGAEGSVDLSRRGLFTRFKTGLEYRIFDGYRKDAFLSWMLEGRVRWFPWIGVRTGVHPWAGLRWRPTDRKASVMVGVEGRFGAPRALVDVRPSRLASRHVGEWAFWETAHERWPATRRGEASPDGSAPAIEPVEVAP